MKAEVEQHAKINRAKVNLVVQDNTQEGIVVNTLQSVPARTGPIA